MAGPTPHVSRPMSIKEISEKAGDFEFNPFIPLKYWMRTADTLLREAHIYEQEENDQQAYLLLMRYATLVTEKLPYHPAAKDPENRQGLKAIQKSLPIVVHTLEALKPRINARYSTWQAKLERRKQTIASFEDERYRPSSQPDHAASDPAVAGNTATLAAAENSQLAVQLAHKEIRRRDAARRATRQAGVSEQEEHERRTAGLWDNWESAYSTDGPSQDDNEMRKNMEATRRRLDAPHDILPDGLKRRSLKPAPVRPVGDGIGEYHYPSITKSQPLRYEDNFDLRPKSTPPNDLPAKPPKEKYEKLEKFERLDERSSPQPPARPDKSPLALPTPPAPPSLTNAAPPSSFTFRPSAYLENGKPLRTVFLPPTLRTEFLKHAESNTRRNLETCGMLCGTLISNALFISRVVIPEQESTSDTCETVNESAFFDYCAAEDLMVLGWIHTHPTQTCFMSSRDLHTHCGYQIMMPESIAIVCAPSKSPSWGVFRLTDPPGMQSVLNCRKTGLFHPHDETHIYTDALRPGHVFEAEGLEFSVIDLRP